MGQETGFATEEDELTFGTILRGFVIGYSCACNAFGGQRVEGCHVGTRARASRRRHRRYYRFGLFEISFR